MTTILEKTAGLVAFVRTIEAGSFANASRLIGASPSAVSKSVGRLEQRLGVRLIQRSTRTLSPTSEGAEYYERVAPLLKAIEEAEDVVQKAETARGLLRLTVPVLLGRTLVAAWVAKFAAQHPQIKLEVDVTDRYVDIIRENYHMAVRIGALQDTGLIARALGSTGFALVAAPRYLKRHGTPRTIEELRKHACLRFVTGGRPFPYAFADGTLITPDGPFDSTDGVTLRQATLEGAGIAQLPAIAIIDEVASGQLVAVLADIPMVRTPIHALHPFSRQLPVRARLFLDFLVEQFKVLEKEGLRVTGGGKAHR